MLLSLFGASAADPLLVDGAAECIYLVGNSLGLQPKLARTYIEEELEKWAKMYVHCSLICGRCSVTGLTMAASSGVVTGTRTDLDPGHGLKTTSRT